MKETLKKLTFAYYIVYVAAILSAVVGYYITFNGNNIIDAQSTNGITISSIFIIYIIGSIPLTLGGFHLLTKKLLETEDSTEKIKKYEKAAIWRLVIIGSSVVIGVFLFYILRSQSMIFCAGIAAIALFFCKPTEAKINSDIQPDNSEV
jgi:MFS family permease